MLSRMREELQNVGGGIARMVTAGSRGAGKNTRSGGEIGLLSPRGTGGQEGTPSLVLPELPGGRGMTVPPRSIGGGPPGIKA